jgi:small-conductance mechanosensitive channel
MNSDSIIETTGKLFDDLITKIIELAPNIVLSLLVLIIGLFTAWILQKLIRKFIFYLDRSINKKLQTKSLDVDLKSTAILISKTFYWFIIILTIAIVTHILGLPVLTVWFNGLVTYLPNILAGVIIVFIGIVVGKLAGDLVTSGSSRSGITNAAQLGNFVRYLLLIISILIAIDQIGIDILFIIVIFSIVLGALLFGAALAFGLGARNSVSNILSSYYLQKTYREGDTIQMDDIEGVIIKITPTSVILETKSGQIMIPAKDFNKKKSILIKRN